MNMILIFSGVFLLSLLTVKWFCHFAIRKNLLDHPNHRSSHTEVTPRGGGIVFVGIWILFAFFCVKLKFFSLSHLLTLVPGGIMIALIGYWDDHGHIPARWRFLIQTIAAIVTLTAIGGFPFFTIGHFVFTLGWLGFAIGLLIMLWSTNLFNFMDGADGMASMEAIFVLGVGGYLLWQVGGRDLAILAWGLVCAILGFLYWNWPPAKIFMGDVGSTFLGFMIAAFAVAGQVWYHLSILFWFVLYSVFWLDATVTLLRRAYAGERLYEAHRLHAFQRLYQVQESRSKLLLSVTTVNIALSIVTLISFHYSLYLPWLMVLTTLLLLAMYGWIEYRLPMYGQKKI